MKIFRALFVFLLSMLSLAHAALPEDLQFCENLIKQVKEHIAYTSEVQNKDEVLALCDRIEKKHFILETGSDDLRVKYVTAQGSFEHVIAHLQSLGEITELVGVIHTPTVATPLCTQAEGPFEGLLDKEIQNDPNKWLTVKSRAQIIREFLSQGKLYVVYPQGGLAKRTPEQLKIYRDELVKYPDNLFDYPISSQEIEPDLIGATYFFKNAQGRLFSFSIKSRQANDIQKQAEWGIWMGPVYYPVVAARAGVILEYLASHGGPDLRTTIDRRALLSR